MNDKRFKEVKDYIEGAEGNGCKLISTEYKNNKTPLDIQCACGKLFKKTFNKFQQGQKQCRECSYRIRGEKRKGENHPYYGQHHTEESKKRMSELMSGENNPMYGKERLDMRGENNPRYNPNLTEEEREGERNIEGYNDFIKNVYKRDNYTCQCCGEKGNGHNLNAHHINGYNWDKDNRTNIDNGICLCKDCHSKFHKIYGRGYNTLKQLEEFVQAQNYSHLIKPLNQTYFKLNYKKVS